MLTQRQAVDLLRSAARPPLTQRLAHGLLRAGFAGAAVETGAVRLYDDEAVTRLAGVPELDPQELPDPCRSGVLVVRRSAQPGMAMLPSPDRRAVAAGPHWLSPYVRVRLRVLMDRHGALPVVATVASHILVAADLVGLELQGPEVEASTRLVLDEPGAWSAAFDGRRLSTPPGNSWLLWKPERAGRESRPASTHWYL